MSDSELVTRTVDIGDADIDWRRVVAMVTDGGARVVLRDGGKSVAALIAAHDLARLERYEAARDERFKILDSMRESFAGVSQEEVEAEVAKALAEVRAEMQATGAQAAPTA